MSKKMTYRERLSQIIDYGYVLFCNQVAGRFIQVDNEASMQLQLKQYPVSDWEIEYVFSKRMFQCHTGEEI